MKSKINKKEVSILCTFTFFFPFLHPSFSFVNFRKLKVILSCRRR